MFTNASVCGSLYAAHAVDSFSFSLKLPTPASLAGDFKGVEENEQYTPDPQR